MEIPISCLFLIIGALSSLITAIITETSIEKLNSLAERTEKNNLILKLRQELDEHSNPFLIIELIAYTAICFLLGYKFQSLIPQYTVFSNIIIEISLILILIVFLRQIFIAIGSKYADSLIVKISWLIKILYYLIFPLYYLSNFIINKITANKIEDDSRDEIDHLVETAFNEKGIEPDEYKILKNAINFSDVRVREVMTPKNVIFSLNSNEKIEQALTNEKLQIYTRIPVWEGNSIEDGVKGYVMTRDIYHAALTNKLEQNIGSLSREINFVFENESLDNVLEMFLKKRKHLFMVVDEYGGIAGLISMEDVLEYILGEEIVDEADTIIDMRLHAINRKDRAIISSEDYQS